MKKNMLKGICTAAVCIAIGTFASSSAMASTINPNEKSVSASFFQDSSSMRSSKMGGKSKMGSKMGSGKMSSDSTGRMSGMKGKSSGGYKNKGTGRSKMDSTNQK